MNQIITAGSELLLERIREGAIKSEALSVVIGIISDKVALREGQATSRIEIVRTEPTEEDIRRSLAELPSARPVDYQQDHATDAALQVLDDKHDAKQSG